MHPVIWVNLADFRSLLFSSLTVWSLLRGYQQHWAVECYSPDSSDKNTQSMNSSAFQHKPCPCSDTDNVADNVKSGNTEKHHAHQTPCQWEKRGLQYPEVPKCTGWNLSIQIILYQILTLSNFPSNVSFRIGPQILLTSLPRSACSPIMSKYTEWAGFLGYIFHISSLLIILCISLKSWQRKSTSFS